MGAAGDCDRHFQPSIAAPQVGPAARELNGGRAEACTNCGAAGTPGLSGRCGSRKAPSSGLVSSPCGRRWQRTVLAAEANTAEVLGDRIATDLWSAGRALGRVTFPRRHCLLADGAVELGGVDRTLEKRKQSRRMSVPLPTTVAPGRPVTARYRERVGVICVGHRVGVA